MAGKNKKNIEEGKLKKIAGGRRTGKDVVRIGTEVANEREQVSWFSPKSGFGFLKKD